MKKCERCGKPHNNLRFCSRECYGRAMFDARGQLANRILRSCDRPSFDSCWRWTGRWHGRYGQLSFNGRRLLAHQASYEVFRGKRKGLCVLHTCDNGACVNPYHLRLGSQADNVADMIAKGRASWQQEDIEIAAKWAAGSEAAKPWSGVRG